MGKQSINEYEFPWLTEFGWIFLIFIVAVIFFHVVLIRIKSIGSVRWKQVDYIWLLMALIGMLGTVGSGRELVAKNLLDLANHRFSFSREMIKRSLEFGASEAICRKFVRGEYSPAGEEFDRLQKGYDSQCDFFKGAIVTFESYAATAEPIDVRQLFGEYPVGGEKIAYENLSDAIGTYNSNLEVVKELQKKAHATEFESIMRLIGPLLIAVALALRITKVTAEVDAERKKLGI